MILRNDDIQGRDVKDAVRCERIAWLHGNPVPYQCTIAKLEKMMDSLASKNDISCVLEL